MTKSLIVFGGSGFIGKALCQEAIKQGIPVISISKHGQPNPDDNWMLSPLITWVAADIFEETHFESYLSDAFCCVNLIGILFEQPKKGLTYDKMIVKTNEYLSQLAQTYNCPYLFLSAKGGPRGYLAAKRQAENNLFHKTNPTMIIRSGLVVTKTSPFLSFQGSLIKVASHLPLVSHFANTVYPTPLEKLVETILIEAKKPSDKLINDIR